MFTAVSIFARLTLRGCHRRAAGSGVIAANEDHEQMHLQYTADDTSASVQMEPLCRAFCVLSTQVPVAACLRLSHVLKKKKCWIRYNLSTIAKLSYRFI